MHGAVGNKWAEKWTLEAVQEKLDQMLSLMREDESIVFIGTAALKVDLYREIIDYWEKKFAEDENVFHTIKQIRSLAEERLFKGALQGKYRETTSIFGLKNNHGWKDKTESDINLHSDGKITILDE